MPSYRENLLGTDEDIALAVHPHWIVFWGEALRGILLFLFALVIAGAVLFSRSRLSLGSQVETYLYYLALGLAVIALIIVFARYISWRAIEYVVTSRRVINIRGVFSKDTFDSSLDFINDLRIDQPFIGRILDYGHIEVLTASDDYHEPRQTYNHVPNPREFLRVLQEQREARRVRRTSEFEALIPEGQEGTEQKKWRR